MSVGDLFLVAVRWLHLLSGAAWVGGSLFYLLVLGPALKRAKNPPQGLTTDLATEFRAVVVTSIIVLVATGVILAFDRLTVGVVAAPYTITLAVKTVLSIWMFLLVRDRRRQARVLQAFYAKPEVPDTGWRRLMAAVSGYNAVVVLGILIFLLSDLLKVMFEIALARGLGA